MLKKKTKSIFFSKQPEINNVKEKLNSSFENIRKSQIKFHSIPKHQLSQWQKIN